MSTEQSHDGARPLPVTTRGRRSRQSLLDGAKRVFGDVGFSEARIVDIAAAAGAASGSFYTYFSSKDEIFVALLRELEDELRSPGHRGADHTAEPFEQILRANLAYLAAYRENAAVMVVWEQVATLNAEVEALRHDASLRFAGRIQHAIAAWQADGRVPAALDAALASVALTGMVSNFAYRWCAQGDEYDLQHAADQLSRLWAGALGLTIPD